MTRSNVILILVFMILMTACNNRDKSKKDYEPASELLTRIEQSRNEKIKAEKVKTQCLASQNKVATKNKSKK